MAQPGNFTPILLYGSSTPGNAPLAANLTNNATGSEIAINVADKNLFFKDSTNTVNTVPIRQSSTSSNGWLSSTDWNTFNNKGSGTVTSVTGTAPVVSSGGTTPAISMAAATTSVNGYLTNTDWNTFNGKQAALVSGTNIKTVGGVSLLGSGDVGTIGVAYGGTGLTSLTANYIPYGNGTSAFSSSANLTFNGTSLGVNTAISGSYNLAVGGGITSTSGANYFVGSLGIGTTGSYKLDVVASGGAVNIFRAGQSGVSNGFTISSTGSALTAVMDGNLLVSTITALQSTSTFYNASNPACAFYRPISSGGASIASFFSDVGGAATFKSYVDSAGAFTTVSDVRTKKNVEPISTGLSVVAKLRPVSFNWRYEDDALPKTNGFIAQEVELVYPEAVTTMDVSKSNGYVDQKMMKNDALLPILVKALQELNEKFDAYVASHP